MAKKKATKKKATKKKATKKKVKKSPTTKKAKKTGASDVVRARVLRHPVPEKLLVHIGDITVSFALLEGTIQFLIGSLIREHQRIGQIIVAELTFKNLRALAISLYKEQHGEDADFSTLRDLMKRAARAEETRNQITHSVWAAGDTVDTVTRIKTTAKEKRGIHFSFEQVGERDLADFTLELKTVAERILALHVKLINEGKALNNPIKKSW